MTDFIAIDVIGDEQLSRMLSKLPAEVQDAAAEGVANLLINIERKYPPYKYITRRAAYPPTGWQSDKQRKFVMAAIREGKIKPGKKNRTQHFSREWKKLGKGKNVMVVNETPYGAHLKDNDRQAAMPRMIGWTKLAQDIKQHEKSITDAANAEAKKAIRRLQAQTRTI